MAACTNCREPLILRINLDAGASAQGSPSQRSTTQEVPDDVELCCGCHFHWECLLDTFEVTQCPSCEKNISSVSASGETQILCVLRNEGGAQEGLDILPILSEELYLKAYPDDRRPKAFLEFCKEGDVEAIVDLLKANEEDDDEAEEYDEDEEAEDDDGMETESMAAVPDTATILRYQDPMDDMRSALHVAVANKKVEVVWLLLLLASTLDEKHFPGEVKQAAQQLRVSRTDQTGLADMRTLKDSEGRLAAEYAVSGLGIDIALLSP